MKKEYKEKREPVVAPGLEEKGHGEDATPEDIKKGQYTRTIRFEPRRGSR